MTELEQFVRRFNKSEEAKPPIQADIDNLEQEFHIFLPFEYKLFLLAFGNIWTPEILDLVVANESDVYDVQQFWSIDKIIFDKRNEWT